uniref:Methyltransferase n=1 Tax=viral metagenome TaxID=1070528 RepID=A0A6C0CJN3_9ZZZZ
MIHKGPKGHFLLLGPEQHNHDENDREKHNYPKQSESDQVRINILEHLVQNRTKDIDFKIVLELGSGKIL